MGYNTGNTQVSVTGSFEANGAELKDPVNFKTEDASGLVGNVGLMLHLLKVMAISVDYNLGRYQSLTLGAGLRINLNED
ncbi:MAG: DUF6588 family protein [Owenweeksia sp.]|nr:DUF6588 family protein [Owenweeksia sp.]